MRSEECDFLFRFSRRTKFFRSFIQSLSVHQRFRLRKEIGKQFLVVVADLIVAIRRSDKVARNHFRSLVNQLIEGVLTIRSRFAPKNGTRLVIHTFGIAIDGLTVGFHVCLLEVGGEAMQVLVVRDHSVARSVKEIVVPHADKGENHREILFHRSILEMFVHFISALVQFHVIVKANTERDRKTDSRPKRVATADPIPEFKHVGGVNAKCGNRFGIGGKSHKMFCNGLFITVKRFENSGLCRFRIRHRFQSRKRFRSHDKERFFNVHFLEGFGHVSAVDIGNKIDFGRIFAVSGFVCIRLQRFGDHHRTEIGTADADVHHITDFLARKSKPLARTNQMRERFHVFENSANFWHHVLAIDANRIISLIAESGMQDGAFFRRVDFFSREKFLAHRIKSGSRQKSA